MRLSTASFILAYVAALAVRAAPTGDCSDLTLRSIDITSAQVARDIGGVDLEIREPKKASVRPPNLTT